MNNDDTIIITQLSSSLNDNRNNDMGVRKYGYYRKKEPWILNTNIRLRSVNIFMLMFLFMNVFIFSRKIDLVKFIDWMLIDINITITVLVLF